MITHAYEITLRHFLNCFFREADNYTLYSISVERNSYYLEVPLLDVQSKQRKLEIKLILSSVLQSPKWLLPVFLVEGNKKHPLAPLQVIELIVDVLSGDVGSFAGVEVIRRVMNSACHLEKILSYRKSSINQAFKAVESHFIQSEQMLLSGHRFQPDAKSREGFSDAEFHEYSPETEGKFQLHYLWVKKTLLSTETAMDQTLEALLISFMGDEKDGAKKPDESYHLFILHPWQALYLLEIPEIGACLKTKEIIDIGTTGLWFYPTSSVRTAYSPKANIMLKFSLNIAITNSVRVNLEKECYRAKAVHELNQNRLGTVLAKKFPDFRLVTDPAFIALKLNGKVLDSSICIIREAPFQADEDISAIAALTEINPFDNTTRLQTLILQVSRMQQLSYEQAARYWYKRYLTVVVAPVLWLYSEYGIALEAHQQNLLVKLENSLPVAGLYRDSQGYYYVKDHPHLTNIATDRELEFLCDGTLEFVDHHFCYYFIVNHLLSVIEALAATEYICEKVLLEITQSFLMHFAKSYQTSGRFSQKLLDDKTLPAKANLMTRLSGLDELQAPLTQQSVYVEIKNPFEVIHECV